LFSESPDHQLASLHYPGAHNVLDHSLSRPKDDRKKNADAIEFRELDDGVSAMSIK
jgi:hypothetical protein